MTTSAFAENIPVEHQKKATFAGGCFWCLESSFDSQDGVLETIVGYANGHTENPSYEEVSKGNTGHTEAIQVTYDDRKVSYETLLNIFWQDHDPLDRAGQFCDRGYSYRPAIFTHDDSQKGIAEQSKKHLTETGKVKGQIVTSIEPLTSFYPAEDYHQDYYKKNPVRYEYYRTHCGRDERLEEIWGKSEH